MFDIQPGPCLIFGRISVHVWYPVGYLFMFVFWSDICSCLISGRISVHVWYLFMFDICSCLISDHVWYPAGYWALKLASTRYCKVNTRRRSVKTFLCCISGVSGLEISWLSDIRLNLNLARPYNEIS